MAASDPYFCSMLSKGNSDLRTWFNTITTLIAVTLYTGLLKLRFDFKNLSTVQMYFAKCMFKSTCAIEAGLCKARSAKFSCCIIWLFDYSNLVRPSLLQFFLLAPIICIVLIMLIFSELCKMLVGMMMVMTSLGWRWRHVVNDYVNRVICY